MQRRSANPRPHWQRKVEEVGLLWHTGPEPYWNESAYYEFTAAEVATLEQATNELHQLCLVAVQHVIDRQRYADLDIPALAVPLIENSWNREPPSLYGRFDLAYDGVNPPKLLEYNADTPTSLLEAAVVQWYWKQECFPHADQFNSLHEQLVHTWREFLPYLPRPLLHFAALDDAEDGMTITYLQDTAAQAGYETKALAVPDIGWNEADQWFVGLDNELIETIFKLYPWEWIVREQFASLLATAEQKTTWIEPAWKMVLSNKGLLPILWELNPNHPLLLPAYFDQPHNLTEWVSKPLLSREGANIVVQAPGFDHETPGEYGEGRRVFQQFARPAQAAGPFPVLGSWIVGQAASGLGIRESATPVTPNTSQVIPHLFA